MSKVEDYRQKLKRIKDWRPYLMRNSGLPGSRGNLELAKAVADLANESHIELFLSIPAEQAPENSPEVFLVFCGVTAMGKAIARGDRGQFKRLRPFASDKRWRVWEAVTIALQYVGDRDMKFLLQQMTRWRRGNWYEQRAAVAALAEPRLLGDQATAIKALDLLDKTTEAVLSSDAPRDESFRVLRQAMGYCWSVIVAAVPREGKVRMERWLTCADPDIHWIMKENLKKNRLRTVDPQWVQRWAERLQKGD